MLLPGQWQLPGKGGRNLAAVLQVARMSMFNVFAAKSSKMEEFEQAQAQMTDQVSNTLRDGWVSSLKQVIRGSLRDVGKECRSRHMLQDKQSSCTELQIILLRSRSYDLQLMSLRESLVLQGQI